VYCFITIHQWWNQNLLFFLRPKYNEFQTDFLHTIRLYYYLHQEFLSQFFWNFEMHFSNFSKNELYVTREPIGHSQYLACNVSTLHSVSCRCLPFFVGPKRGFRVFDFIKKPRVRQRTTPQRIIWRWRCGPSRSPYQLCGMSIPFSLRAVTLGGQSYWCAFERWT
jgi:hypothetical protein